MRRGRIFIYLALILILGVVAIYVVGRQFLVAQQPLDITPGELLPTPVVQTVDVVVVTQRVSRGDLLTGAVLGVVPIQRELMISGMFTNIEDVTDRRVKFDLDAGILLTENMIADTGEALSTTGSDAALMIPRGMVAVSIPISRLSSVSYAPQRGDHVNVIVTLMFVDIDTGFQTILPNNTAALIAPGPNVLIGLGAATTSQSESLTQAEQSRVGQETQQTINAGVTSLGEFGSTLNTQIASGGAASPQGRAELDPLLEQTLYVVPSEAQRPRLVSQSLIQDVMVLQVGDFPYKKEATTVAVAAAQPTPVPPEGQGTTTEAAVTETTPAPDVITLIVTPQDAVTLNYLIYSGAELTLALRAAGDDSRVQTEAVTLQFLLDQYNIPIPVKLPYGMEPRVDRLAPPVLPNDRTVPTTQR